MAGLQRAPAPDCGRGLADDIGTGQSPTCNPNFSKGGDYTYNCGYCSATYEMRRRGFDVEAQPLHGLLVSDWKDLFIVQYMAENIPTPSAGGVNVDALGEAVIKEAMARIKLAELAEAVTKEIMARIDVDELCETVTREVTAHLVESSGANPAATELAEVPQDGAENAGGTSTPPAAEPPQEPVQAAQEAPKPKTTRKNNKAKTDK